MKPFSQVATPHRDILEGRLTMDVFAADLWKVIKGQAPDEYQNSDVFFRKTFTTAGLKNLLDIAEKRLKGKGGDPIVQLQTPFGGGKTHTLIALYHKAKEWNANVVAIDGTVLDPKEVALWEEIEKQLEGKVLSLKGKTSPGREKLEKILQKNQPILILVDELLQYVTKASGIKVGDSNLASQTLAFMQELTGSVSTLDKALLVITLPSSVLEHYDENAERLFQQLQKIIGRLEKIYTPVQDEEVSQVIRRRLFKEIDETSAKRIVEEFLEYAEKEKILPMDKPIYRDRFLKSYPFQPEVIDVLYKRWGSFPTFQRTRGVLRILALATYCLKEKNIPFIRLSDFDLENEEIRRELINHIGSEYESVIYADITSKDSGSKKVDKNLGDTYRAFSFGTKISTSIFLNSFSGGPEKGATLNDLKLSCAEPTIPSTIITEAITKLKENLFFLSDTGLFFTNQPNMNRILLHKIETLEPDTLKDKEKEILHKCFSKEYSENYIWPKNSKDVPDTRKLKLIVLEDENKANDFLENCGNSARVYRNTMIFLCPLESEKQGFYEALKKKLAWELIDNDKTLSLTESQKKEVKEKIKKAEIDIRSDIRSLYRLVLVPGKDGLKEIDLGISTYGMQSNIDDEVYERLRSEGDVLEKLSPLILKDKYLASKEYIETKNIFESFYKTPGEIRIVNEEVFKVSIKEGVRQGTFGIGILEAGTPIPKPFNEEVTPDVVEGEVLVKADLCKPKSTTELIQETKTIYEPSKTQMWTEPVKEDVGKKEQTYKRAINLKLNVPVGKLSDVVKLVNYINSKFNQIHIKVDISAKEGEITTSDYEDRIKEAIKQAGFEIEEENIEFE